ncbi:HAD family hydrolase [Acetobacter oeni]|uniref:Hydrolase phosphatase n=1 Tax=Acetobacter oeni TaxID=304077 RepID=A0A511XLW1_9PROT|nr:HAD-IA family hydrolase [Acetobacter oeni]MBB3882954.1 HAD superfamily hydrolase (TIGR01509 family) [Acetobacter oeni]NHO19036.1 HAD-IA family hydrolase [Acetobacter oeni]GBR09275.1 phosphatase [Acetobacter oeni LMG 21952]GEN63924.1 hydrolase phosphatase [Acetobacter oeni]
MTSALSPDGSLRLVIFDCDGVLIDSESTSCRIVAQAAREAGLDVADEDAVDRFAGKALPVLKQEIEQATGHALPSDWTAQLKARFIEAFGRNVDVIDGTHAMLEAVKALSLPVRVGSNSSIAEMDAKFGATGLQETLAGRIHSAVDMNAPKPAPDVYLHAAAEEGVKPENCVVLEDSDTGARAAIIAGMTCVLLRKKNEPAPDWPGLVRIETLSEFPPLLATALTAQRKRFA